MDLGLKGRTAVICGGSRGIGLAIAQKLAEEGADVALIARDLKELSRVCRIIENSTNRRAYPFALDLSRPSDIPGVVKKVLKKIDHIDILINNAGGPPAGGFFDVKDGDWKKSYDQNLLSAVVMTREIVPAMKKRNYGRIINIASQLVKEPGPRMILSNVFRSGAVSFSKTISFELAAHNITVNTLCPGAIMTQRLRSLMELRAKREKRPLELVIRDVAASIPLKRIGKPEEFANMAVFLASERASYITGTLIAVDGGMTKSLM